MSRPCRASESLELSSDLLPPEWSRRGRREVSPGGSQCAQSALPCCSPFQAHDAATEPSYAGLQTTQTVTLLFAYRTIARIVAKDPALNYCQSCTMTPDTRASLIVMSQSAPSGVSLPLRESWEWRERA